MNKLGRPLKGDRGLTEVLYIRVDDRMLAKIDERVVKRRKTQRGITRADVVREVIEAWLATKESGA